jgi:hypothetical protein
MCVCGLFGIDKHGRYAKRISRPKLHFIDLMKTYTLWIFFLQNQEFLGLIKSSPFIHVNNNAPLKNVFFTTYGPS